MSSCSAAASQVYNKFTTTTLFSLQQVFRFTTSLRQLLYNKFSGLQQVYNNTCFAYKYECYKNFAFDHALARKKKKMMQNNETRMPMTHMPATQMPVQVPVNQKINQCVLEARIELHTFIGEGDDGFDCYDCKFLANFNTVRFNLNL